MDNLNNLTGFDTNGVAVVELGYKKTGATEIEQLTGRFAIVDEAQINEAINTPSVVNLVITSKTSGYVDELLRAIMISGDPVVYVRLGVVSGDQRIYLPWQTHIVQNFQSRPFQDGHQIGMKTVDLLQQLHRSPTTASHQGTISSIVEKIFKKWKLQVIVEPTQDKESSYIQSNQSDVEFVTRRLLPRALNTQGRGNYRLFVQDDVVHFHTLDYCSNVHQLSYFSPSAGLDLRFQDDSQTQINLGAAGIIGLMHDPYTGESKVLRENPSVAVNHAKITPKLSSVPGSAQLLPLHLGQNRLQEAQAIVQNAYEASYNAIFRAELEMSRTPHVRLNDLISLIVQPSQGTVSPWSGLYSVLALKHAMARGALTSTFSLARGEMTALGVNSRLLEALKIKASENFATGQPINVPVVQSSRSSRGAGEKLAGGQTVKPVNQL